MQRTELLTTLEERKIQEVLVGKYFNNKSLEPAFPEPPYLASYSLALPWFLNPLDRQPFCKYLAIQQGSPQFLV